jgi:hypothetical protein
MPFTCNWHEELMAEWLDLDGFLVRLQPPVPNWNGRGGRLEPDVVGVRFCDDTLEIRHCETEMWASQGPEEESRRYKQKFSPQVQKNVETEFRKILRVPEEAKCKYEKWIVFIRIPQPVRERWNEDLLGPLFLRDFNDFVREQVFPSIRSWRDAHPDLAQGGLPKDKWLLTMLDYLRWCGLLPENPRAISEYK